jgi:hypothetical protein
VNAEEQQKSHWLPSTSVTVIIMGSNFLHKIYVCVYKFNFAMCICFILVIQLTNKNNI